MGSLSDLPGRLELRLKDLDAKIVKNKVFQPRPGTLSTSQTRPAMITNVAPTASFSFLKIARITTKRKKRAMGMKSALVA